MEGSRVKLPRDADNVQKAEEREEREERKC